MYVLFLKNWVFLNQQFHNIYGEKYGYHTHYLPTQAAIDYLLGEFVQMQNAALTVDRDMTKCQCEYRKGNVQE